jgi:hypothetical protein
MTALRQTNFGHMWGEKEEQNAAHIRTSPGKRGNRGVCMGKEGSKDGEKTEKENTTAGDKI